MKKTYYWLSLVFTFVIPLFIIYVYADKYTVIVIEKFVEAGTEYLHNRRYGIEMDTIDLIKWIKYLFFAIIINKVVVLFISDRKSGTNLRERKSDLLINLWFIVSTAMMWFIIYKFMGYVGINTEAKFESSTFIIVSIVVGCFFRIKSVYLHIMDK